MDGWTKLYIVGITLIIYHIVDSVDKILATVKKLEEREEEKKEKNHE
jgi:hypothetical protein